jgi:hypothetical protein
VKRDQDIEAASAQRKMLRCSKRLLDITRAAIPTRSVRALASDDIERLATAVGVGAPDPRAPMDHQLVRACEEYAAAVTE